MLQALVVAMLAMTGSAYAATPVSDQYQSAPPPVVKPTAAVAGATASPGATAAPAQPAPATGTTGTSGTKGTPSKLPISPGTPPAGGPPPRAASPVVVEAAPANAPLAEPKSGVPVLAIAAIGLLVLALGFAAVGRARRPATGS